MMHRDLRRTQNSERAWTSETQARFYKKSLIMQKYRLFVYLFTRMFSSSQPLDAFPPHLGKFDLDLPSGNLPFLLIVKLH